MHGYHGRCVFMLKKHLLCDYDKKSIMNFLCDYLADISIEENRLLWDSIRSFINDYENNERKMKGYYCYINYLQGIVWHSEKDEWVFAVISERALRELLRIIPENQKINCIFENKYKSVVEEYINILTINDDNSSIIGVKGVDFDALSGSFQNIIESKKHIVVTEFKEYATLSGRLLNERFVVEGERLVKRALEDGQLVEKVVLSSKNMGDDEIINLCRERKIPYCITNPGIMACMTSTHPVPEVLCSVRSKVLNQDRLLLSPKRNYFLILDGISNPDNLGIIVRTVDAAGVSGLILLSNSTHYLNKNAIRGGRGAIGRIPVYMSDDDNKVFSILNANNFKIIGTSARFGVSNFYEINYGYDNIAVVVGNETNGVRKEILEKCNEYAKIPMAQGQSSLNIAVTSALFMYEYTRLFSAELFCQNYTGVNKSGLVIS